MLIFIIFLIY